MDAHAHPDLNSARTSVIPAPLPSPAPRADVPDPDKFYFEINLAEHTIFCLSTKPADRRRVQTYQSKATIEGRDVDVTWEVEPGTKYGLPGAFAIDVVYALFKLSVKNGFQGPDKSRVHFVSLRKLLKLIGKPPAGPNMRLLRAALRSLSAITIHSTYAFVEQRTKRPIPVLHWQPFKIAEQLNHDLPDVEAAAYNYVEFAPQLLDQVEYNGLLLLLVKPQAWQELQPFDKLLLPYLAKLLRLDTGTTVPKLDLAEVAKRLNVYDSNLSRLRATFYASLTRIKTHGTLRELLAFSLTAAKAGQPVYLKLQKRRLPKAAPPTHGEQIFLADIYQVGGSRQYQNRWLKLMRTVGADGVRHALSLHKQRLQEYRGQAKEVNPSKLLDTIFCRDIPKLKEPAVIE